MITGSVKECIDVRRLNEKVSVVVPEETSISVNGLNVYGVVSIEIEGSASTDGLAVWFLNDKGTSIALISGLSPFLMMDKVTFGDGHGKWYISYFEGK